MKQATEQITTISTQHSSVSMKGSEPAICCDKPDTPVAGCYGAMLQYTLNGGMLGAKC
jgi:hypothetical protein